MNFKESAAIKRVDKGLTGQSVLLLGAVLMTLYYLYSMLGFTNLPPYWFVWVGTAAYPVFLFMLIERSSAPEAFGGILLKVYIGSVVMGLADHIVGIYFRRGDAVYPQANAFKTFFIVLLIVKTLDCLFSKTGRWYVWAAALAALCALNYLYYAFFDGIYVLELFSDALLPLPTFAEGGWYWILMCLPFYFFRSDRKKQLIAFGIYAVLGAALAMYLKLSALDVTWGLFLQKWQYVLYGDCRWMSALAIPVIIFYNGARGKGSSLPFYIYYPCCVYGLFAISWLVY